MYLARSSLGRRPLWNVTYGKSTGYNRAIVSKVATKIEELITKEESSTLKTKFEHAKYLEASLCPILLEKPN